MEEKSTSFKTEFIDLDKVLKGKNPALNKFMPGFIKSYLKRIIHQDELNEYIKKYGHLVGIEFIDASLKQMEVKLEVEGLENLPKTERCIVASNHPLGGLDGVALMLVISRVRPDIVFPVNDILMNVKNLAPLFIPINKHGSNAENIKIINDTFASDKLVCYFPFGLVSRKRKGEIKDLSWKKTFITKSKRFKRDIIPTHISGRNTNWFYNLSNFRKKVGIKANIEMLYVVDEMLKQKGQTIKFTFGKPIPWTTFDKRHKNEGWAELLRRYSYKLAEGYNKSFEEFISKL
jgi:putative hemolysin